ncbi:MAG: sigma-54-dependent Fis family transcriptional regulator [Bdellovibrionales bacterium]|jgi:Nif-specific regulatory protein|nr:sigma-54-dependent Fis family transcriptional regulator [Bdellovibrionales bacterium]
MSIGLLESSNELDQLSASLLSLLDEVKFFNELSSYFQKGINCKTIEVYKQIDEQTLKMISKNCKKVSKRQEKIINIDKGIIGYVVRTKRPYFTNNIKRDPLFAEDIQDGVIAQLCIPVYHEGVLISVINFISQNEENIFSRDNVTDILNVLKIIEKPLSNLKLYLSALSLNKALLIKVEEKEKELLSKKNGLNIIESFKISMPNIIGKSESFINILKLAKRSSESDANISLYGEIGTGKEMIAKAIHCMSKRRENAFISVDCSAYSADQLEVELFGGAIVNKPGAIDIANNGTILLKRAEKLPLSIQSKLLYFLKEGLAFKAGEQVPYKSDVRILISNENSIQEAVDDNRFREDLYFFLSTIEINIPGLAERSSDIELLANHFLNSNREIEKQKSFSPGAIKALLEYSWPGNLRELQNIVERSYILSSGMVIEKSHLSEEVSTAQSEVVEEEKEEVNYIGMTLDSLEKMHICNTLDHLSGNKTKTAKQLGITVKTLYNKLHSYGMIAAKTAQ